MNFKPRKGLEITYSGGDNECQCSYIVFLNKKRPNILVGVYYRHLKKKPDNFFLLNLKETLTKLT